MKTKLMVLLSMYAFYGSAFCFGAGLAAAGHHHTTNMLMLFTGAGVLLLASVVLFFASPRSAAFCIALLLAPAVASADYVKGTDGYYYKDGDTAYPYEQYEDTCWKNVTYQDGCCRTYTKRVAYTCLKYRRVAVADPETGIERFAQQLLAMKQGEMKSEWKLREQYAFSKEAQSLAEAFGVTQYRVQGYGQNLNYGDEYAQYPALSGNTQYGVKEYAADFYGSAAQTLVDVNQTIAMQSEVQKLQQQYAAESNESWKQYSTDIVENAGNRTAVLAQIQQQNETIALLGQTMQSLIEAAKPDVASVRTRETVPYGVGSEPLGLSASPTAELFASVNANSCNQCHEDHAAVKSAAFPAGVNLDDAGNFSQKQLERIVVLVGSGKMPKKKQGVAPLSKDEKSGYINHILSFERN